MVDMTRMTELPRGNGVSPTSTAWNNDHDGNPSFTANVGKGNFLAQYKALILRNLTLKLRERRKTLTEFLMPLYFITILAIIRLVIKDTTFDPILVPHGEASLMGSFYSLEGEVLHITPNSSLVEDFMDEVKNLAWDRGVQIHLKYYDTEEDMVKQFLQNTTMYYAVVLPEDPVLNMSYKIRLNSDLYLASPSSRYSSGEQCRGISQTGGLPLGCPANTYYHSGFTAIQALLDSVLIQLYTGDNTTVPDVTLQLFPKDEFTASGSFVLRSMVPLYMVFAWAQFIVYMMMLVVEEKEKRIKEGMKMMGLRDSVYWLSWFTIYDGYVFILALICIIILPLAKVFNHVNLFLLFLLFILYGSSSIVFALMLTPFFNNAKIAGIVANLTQVAFSLLYYLQVYLGDQISTATFWALGLFSPCAFSLALDKALFFDFYGGLSYDQLWEGEGLPFAGSLIMISVDIVLYLSLAYYLDNVIPSEYGTKRKPWFIFQKSFWIPQNKGIKFDSLVTESNDSYEEDPIPESDDLEPVSPELKGKAAVRIRHLKKTFHPRGKDPIRAVDGISLDIYESQITAILGHNGAGKTTLFNILTGMLAPTSGTASIFGLDISDANDLTEIRRITGVCPQHDIIFNTLTPREHLSFFARIRGIHSSQVDSEVDKTLKEVDLFTKADTKAADLSGGQKRKLSIGIALIGDPKLIFLDEPTAGVDAYSRRRLWTLLRGRKQGKVILLTTHFMDEADILADRKAIVSKGRLRCFGSSLFLKNKFGLGYHLTLVVNEHIEANAVTEVLQTIVREVKLARRYGKEMSYVLPSDSASNFPALFTLLDQHIKGEVQTVGIEGYGISMTTLEEVFLTLSEENETEGAELRSIENLGQQMIMDKSPSASPLHSASTPVNENSPAPMLKNGTTPGAVDSEGFAINAVDVRPTKGRTFEALLKVRIINTLREPGAIFFLLVLPLAFTAVSIFLSSIQTVSVPTDDVLALNTGIYGSLAALVCNHTDHSITPLESALNAADTTVTPYDGKYETIFDMKPSFTAWDVREYPQSEIFVDSVNMTMAYNDSYVHSIPILLNLLSNSMLSAADFNTTISVFSQMLPSIRNVGSFDTATFFSPMMIGFTFTMMPAGMGIELVYDREIKIRDLLRLNGVGFNLYFSTLFSTMILMYFINYAGLLIIIAAFNLSSLTIPGAFACIAILYLLYMPCALLYSAVFCYIFDKSETARQFYPSIATTLGFVGYTAVAVVDMTMGLLSDTNPAPYIHYALSALLPHYLPFGILYYVNRIYLMCSINSSCDQVTFNDYMTPEIIFMFVMVIVNIPLYYILLRLADTLKLGGSWKEALWMKGTSKKPKDSEVGIAAPTGEDEDVQEERASVAAALRGEGEAPPVLIYDLGKIYAKGEEKNKNPCKPSKKEETQFVALKSVSFAVKSGQVFGLLGPNGAGKTTSLRIMTAQESPSKGQVQICGTDVISSLSAVFENLGYCPQHDSLWKNITVAEHIACFAAIRGVNENQVQELTSTYLKGLEIMEHKNKRSKNCSGGTKRKLSYILSMIGKPQVVLLDEPSTGMDPQSKRFLWNSILASFKGDRSAILTTHSMEEADALCSRIGILVRGGMRCIGAIQHLKNKYGGGYSLELKLSPQSKTIEVKDASGSSSPSGGITTSDEMQTMVKETFPNAYVDEQFDERIIFKIPQSDVTSLSGCFSMLEKAKRENLLQEYALSQTTLEQVFLKFARQQEEGDETEDNKEQQCVHL